MDTEKLAEYIAQTIMWLIGASLLIWLLIELPLWLVPIVFGVVFFFIAAFGGGMIAIASMGVAIIIKLVIWLISHRSRA